MLESREIDEEQAKKIRDATESLENTVSNTEKKVEEEFMIIFRNTFVEQKHIATRPLKKAA